jgi:hypothetical protein
VAIEARARKVTKRKVGDATEKERLGMQQKGDDKHDQVCKGSNHTSYECSNEGMGKP